METTCGLFKVEICDSRAEKIFQEKRVNAIALKSASCLFNYNYDNVYEQDYFLTQKEFNHLKECLNNGKIKISLDLKF